MSMNIALFWNVALCSLVHTNRRFRGAYQDEELMFVTNPSIFLETGTKYSNVILMMLN
jgi:hypothetical protein